MDALTITPVPIDELTPHPQNPRQGDVGAIVESIRAHGFFNAIGVQRSSGFIVYGNHRWQAARRIRDDIAAGELDWYVTPDSAHYPDGGDGEPVEWQLVFGDLSVVPVTYLDIDDDEALRVLLIDNRTADVASYDDHALAALLTDLTQHTVLALDGTGFDPADLDDLLRKINPPNLDALDREGPQAVDDWEVIRLAVPPPLFKRFNKVMEQVAPDGDDVARLRELVKRAASASA